MAGINEFFKNETSDKKTILFLDFHNLIYRTINIVSAKAKKDMMSQSEMYAYWKYMMVNNIINSVKTYTPNKVVIAIDSKVNWRKEIYPDYKAQRKTMRDKQTVVDFKAFWPILEKFVVDFKAAFTNFMFIDVDNAEGDDTIAVLVKSIGKEYKECIVITNDGDYVQLLKQSNVKIFNPLLKKFVKSMNPSDDLLGKILIGDKSDNITAIAPRLGKATAAKIIKAGIEDYLTENAEANKLFIMNKQLIDWDYIPNDIQSSIMESYNKYDIKPLNSTKLMMFFASTGVPALAEKYSEYSKFLKKVC